ncbi:MAG: FliH/SctL family protein [Deltaproteobacteria bacterium]|nr:FliH/SctL family protein [Deltaproteobacteria bacterium]
MSGFVKTRFFEGRADPERRPRDFREVDFETEARRVFDEAVSRGAEIERSAYQEGFAKGERAGIELGKQQMGPVLERLHDLLEELTRARESMLAAMEGKVVALAIDMAEKIIRKEIERDGDVVKTVVREVMMNSVDHGRVTVRVAPSEHMTVQELRPDLLKMKGVDEVVVVPDERITPGGCLLETSKGVVDARLETGLSEIRTLVE